MQSKTSTRTSTFTTAALMAALILPQALPRAQVSPKSTRPEAPNTEYLIQAYAHPDSKTASEALCVRLTNLITLEGKNQVDVTCVVGDADAAVAQGRLERARSEGDYRFLIRFVETAKRDYELKIENLKPFDETDFEKASWLIEARKGYSVRDLALQSRVKNLLTYDRKQRLIKEYLLANVVRHSQKIALNERGQYVEKSTNREITADEAYATFRDESKRQKNFLRAAFEIVVGNGVGAIGYWNSPSLQDKEYDSYWESMRLRFTSLKPVRMDDNDFRINLVGHPVSGYYFYGFGRANGYSSLESFLLSFAGSAIWEYFVEGQEVVSINDQVVTPIAGLVIGEVFHQLRGEFLRRGPSRLNRFLKGVFGTPEGLDAFTRKQMIKSNGLAAEGFSPDAFSKISLFAGSAKIDDNGTDQRVYEMGFDSEIFNIPGYNQPGVKSALLKDAPYTKMTLKAALGEDGLNEALAYLETALVGYYRQNIEGRNASDLKGYSYLIGLNSAFHYEELYGARTKDLLGIVNVLGPTLDVNLHVRGMNIRVRMDAFADFASIRSLAIDDFRAAGGSLEGTKEILRRRDYYYAFGVSQSSMLVMKKGPFEMGGSYTFRHYDSIEGVDLRQERLTNDFNLVDQRSARKVWVAYTLPKDRVKLELGASLDNRMGRIDEADPITTKRKRRTVYARMRMFF